MFTQSCNRNFRIEEDHKGFRFTLECSIEIPLKTTISEYISRLADKHNLPCYLIGGTQYDSFTKYTHLKHTANNSYIEQRMAFSCFFFRIKNACTSGIFFRYSKEVAKFC